MLTKRIIPCLDVKNGRVVKGTNFEGLEDVSDPVELAAFYNKSGADELVLYDIMASYEDRGVSSDILRRVAAQITIPFTVGGGIHTLADFERVISCGADKVSINSGAIKNQSLIKDGADKYGSGCVVFAMDVKKVGDEFHVFADGGRKDTKINAVEWAKKGADLGAGELVINSIDTDGVKGGFDLELLKAISSAVNIPITASGGAGSMEDFLTLFQTLPEIAAGLAASVFHYRTINIGELKKYLSQHNIPVNLVALEK